MLTSALTARGASEWRVNAIDEVSSNDVVLTLRRGTLGETHLLARRRAVAGVEVGQPIICRTDIVREKRIFGVIKVRLSFQPQGESWKQKVQLPLLRLHCPKREGCEAEYSMETRAGQTAEMTMSVFGLGGGSGREIKVSQESTYATVGAQCIEISTPATVTFEQGTFMLDGEPAVSGMRMSIEGVDPRHLDRRPIPQALDECGRLQTQLTDSSVVLSRSYPDNPALEEPLQKERLKVEEQSTGNLNLGFEGPAAFPVKLAVEYQRTLSHAAEIATGLKTGAEYLAYFPAAGGFELCWSVSDVS